MIDLKTYTKKDVAGIFGVSVKTIGRLVAQRKIKYIKVGRQIRFLQAHITEFERRNEYQIMGG